MTTMLTGILVTSLITINALAHAPLISIKSDQGVKNLQAMDLGGLQLTPLRKIKAELDSKHGIDFFSLYEIEIENNEKVIANYTVPNQISNANGLRISIYRIISENGESRTLELLHTDFYKSGTEVKVPVVGKKRKEALYIVTAEASKSEADIDQNLAYMLQLNVQKKLLKVTGISTNLKMSDVNFSLQTTKDDNFSLALSEGYRRLNNPHWVAIIYPKYKQ